MTVERLPELQGRSGEHAVLDRLLAAFLGTAGAGALMTAFDDTVRAIDVRYDAALVC